MRREQVVPPASLVEHDPVEEAADPEAEDDPCGQPQSESLADAVCRW
jgi:hypothetical protein